MSDVFIIVDFNSICRFCLESKGVLSSIFDSDEDNSLVLQIVELVDIEVNPDEDLPTKVCHRCRFKIEQSFEFKKMINQSQKALRDSVYDINKDVSNDLTQAVDSNVDESLDFLSTLINKNNVRDCNDVQEFCNSAENSEKDDIGETVQCGSPKFVEGQLNHADGNDASAGCVKMNNVDNPENSTVNDSQYPSIFAAHKKNLCLLCLKKYWDEESLHRHVDEHVEGTDLEPYYKCKDRNIYCKVCCKYFDYRFNFLSHQREHLDLKPFACLYPDCNAAYFTNAALKQHTQSHAGKHFICATCGIRFKRKQDLRGHEIIHEDANKKYRCGLCGLLCKNRLTYRHHVRKHRTQPMYKCDHCPKEYFSGSELTRHHYSHSNVKKFQCNICSCAYFSQSALKRHIRYHDQPKLHKCYVCSVVCNSWGEFIDHRKQHESEEYPFRCPHCNKGYFIKPSLTRHTVSCLKKAENEKASVRVKVKDVQRQGLIVSILDPTDLVYEDISVDKS